MSVFTKIAGTVSSLFQLGRRGPQLKNSSGAVEHRNAADSAYAIARGADPVIADDLVTKRYGDANYTSGGGGAKGTGSANLGAFPGTDSVAVVITGQAGIVAGSFVEAHIDPTTATAEHSVDEHLIEAIRVYAGSIVAGTGFTVWVESATGIEAKLLYGHFNFAWSWR